MYPKPGDVVSQFISKNGENVEIRYPTISDASPLREYINIISKEDTFVSLSGEQLTLEEETEYVTEEIKKIENHDSVLLLACVGERIIGACGVSRENRHRARGAHIGVFGISLSLEYRGQGIGFELATRAIEESVKNITGLRIINLSVYDLNEVAYAMYLRLGFKPWGRLPEGIKYKDSFVDLIEMYLPVGSE